MTVRELVLHLATHRRHLRGIQVLLLLATVVLLVVDEPLGLPPWLPLLPLGTWAVVASYDMVVFPGRFGILRQVVGVLYLVLGVFALVVALRFMSG